MKPLFIIAFSVLAAILSAQETQQISTGPGYNKQSYFNLSAGTEHQVANASWDIAFSIAPEDAGVFINESVGSTAGSLPIQAFYTYSDDFNVLPEISFFEAYPILNRETSWSYGALDEYRDGGNPYDFGWGVYNPATQEINGGYVYAIQLRDGTYIKFQIQSLINGVYTFRYANLKGTGEVTKTISKADHAGKMLAYFSFDSGETVDVEPAEGFDLIFCRYYTLLDQGGGDSIQYLVTGILSAAGVEVAEANHVNPDSVQFQDYADTLSSQPDIIGYDWKVFDLNNFSWILPDDLVYFVKAKDDHIWKIRFVEFQGSGTGTAIFEKTDLGIFSAVEDPSSPLSEFAVYPNPASNEINVLFASKNNSKADYKIQILDASGRLVDQYETHAGEGLNVFTIQRENLCPGLYFIRLMSGEQSVTNAISITR